MKQTTDAWAKRLEAKQRVRTKMGDCTGVLERTILDDVQRAYEACVEFVHDQCANLAGLQKCDRLKEKLLAYLYTSRIGHPGMVEPEIDSLRKLVMAMAEKMADMAEKLARCAEKRT